MGRKRSRKRGDIGAPSTPAMEAHRRPRPALYAAIVAVLALAGWAWLRGARAPGGSAAFPRDARLNVLLVTIDTLRADALGVYGRPDVETPLIDRLARTGARFESARAHNVVTLPSHANILSGRYPLDHGVRDNAGFRFPRHLDTLATLLKAHGHRTGAFVSAFPVDSQFGLARGFDVYDDSFRNLDTAPAFVMEERRGPDTVARAMEWIGSAGGAPWFAWVHVFEPHFPYAPPEPYATRYAGNPYLGEVAATDALLRPLIEPLLEAGEAARTLIVLTADHGESLGEHGERTHGIFAYEATLRVPLILHGPGLRPVVVGTAVRHVDVLPTVLDALGLELPGELPGRSLLPVTAGLAEEALPSYFEALTGMLSRGWAPLYGVVDGSLKHVALPLPELYDLTDDPSETANLAARRGAVLASLAGTLAELRQAESPLERRDETAETRRQLEALGYVSSGAGTEDRAFTEDDDPKRLIVLDEMMDDIAGRHSRGDLAGALTIAEDLVARRPQMPASWVRLGFLQRELGDIERAVDALGRALSLSPADPDTLALLGAYLNEAGRAQESVDLLSASARADDADVDVTIAYGVALAQVGRFDDSLAAFEKARAADPSHAMALVNMATTWLMSGRPEQARPLLEQALAINPGLARAHNTLGVIAAGRGETEKAIVHWQRAVEMDPREFDTLYNLGLLLRERGRLEEARVYLERFVREAPPARYAADVVQVRGWLADTP